MCLTKSPQTAGPFNPGSPAVWFGHNWGRNLRCISEKLGKWNQNCVHGCIPNLFSVIWMHQPFDVIWLERGLASDFKFGVNSPVVGLDVYESSFCVRSLASCEFPSTSQTRAERHLKRTRHIFLSCSTLSRCCVIYSHVNILSFKYFLGLPWHPSTNSFVMSGELHACHLMYSCDWKYVMTWTVTMSNYQLKHLLSLENINI